MNRLQNAADILKVSWCAGRWRNPDNETVKFCSMGALGETFGIYEGVDFFAENCPFDDDGYNMDRFRPVAKSDEVRILAFTILEQYPDFANGFINEEKGVITNEQIIDEWDAEEVVIAFNDAEARTNDEIVAVFEKAAVRLDEAV